MKTLELIHAKIHGLRMIPKYRPSQFEKDLNKIISEEFKDDCSECRHKIKLLELQEKLNPSQQQQKKSSFLGGLFE